MTSMIASSVILVIMSSAFAAPLVQNGLLAKSNEHVRVRSGQPETQERSSAPPIAPTSLWDPPQPVLEFLHLCSSPLLTSRTPENLFSFRSFVAKLEVGKK